MVTSTASTGAALGGAAERSAGAGRRGLALPADFFAGAAFFVACAAVVERAGRLVLLVAVADLVAAGLAVTDLVAVALLVAGLVATAAGGTFFVDAFLAGAAFFAGGPFFAAGFTGGPLAAVGAALVDAFPVAFLAGAALGTTFFVALRLAAAGLAAALRAGVGLVLDAAFAGWPFFAAAADSPRVAPPLTRRSTRPSRPVTAAMPTSFHQTTDTAPVRAA